MSIWPFRRKTGRKRSRSGSGSALSDNECPAPTSQALRDNPSATVSATRTASQKKQRTEKNTANKLNRQARTYSFSPGRNDSIRASGRVDSVPPHPSTESPQSQSMEDDKGQGAAWSRVPTLHKKDSGRRVLRRKSTKSRRKNTGREAEIKAMSNFAPVRPAVGSWPDGRPVRAESKRAKGGITNAGTWNPASDVSLPLQGSIHSTMSSESEHASYKVSALEALAPRPTLRYASNSRHSPSTGSLPARTCSQRRRLVKQEPISEATLKAHKRIDSLADDLDAAGLRELMERDKRRRERKKQREQERIEGRLSRRAEKQKEAEAEAEARGTPSPQNLERGVMGRDVAGLGLDSTSAVVTSSRRRPSDDSIQKSYKSPEAGRPVQEAPGADARNHQAEPLNKFYRTDSIPQDIETSPPEPIPPSAAPSPVAEEPRPARMAFLRSKKTRSRTTLASDEKRNLSSLASKSNDSVAATKHSDTSGRGKSTLSALIRWGTRSIRRSSGPSSFSNTSREEMQAAVAQGPPAHAQAQAQEQAPARAQVQAQAQHRNQNQIQPEHQLQPIQTTQTTGTISSAVSTDAPAPSAAASQPKTMGTRVPRRTRSRFREDLPEMPISPPESRAASQEPEHKAAMAGDSENKTHEAIPEDTAPELASSPAIPRDASAAEPQSAQQENMRQTPTSLHRLPQNSPQPHSISLASIDSEGSWLSGKLGKRSSSGMGMRDSLARQRQANRRRSVHSTGGTTEDELADDEYLSNLATPPRERQLEEIQHGRPSSEEGRPSSDDEQLADIYAGRSEVTVGTVKTHHPQIHRQEHQASLMKSREGLLNEFEEDRHSTPSAELELGETSPVQRAASIDLGRNSHARRMSG
ncbi:hypothetical protein ACRALDRAFT_2038827 [Sodiomyces alcalophilus JCM 7366]|uniref:uncharacterized protein n=1 Tax=Sodiomyces alcalophilus JCM 7366 TaxID=591952 RepID=UPI0039B69E95